MNDYTEPLTWLIGIGVGLLPLLPLLLRNWRLRRRADRRLAAVTQTATVTRKRTESNIIYKKEKRR